jgi:chromosome segregation ATPase
MRAKDDDGRSADFLSEIASLRNKLDFSTNTRHELNDHVTKLSEDLEILTSDRGALVAALENVESILVQVNHKIDSVTDERDKLANLYHQASRKLSQAVNENKKTAPIRLPVPASTSAIQTQTAGRESPVSVPQHANGTDIAKQFKVLHEERDRMAESNENLREEIRMFKDKSGGDGYDGVNSDEYHVLETERDGLKFSLETCERDKSLLEDNYSALEKHVGRLKEDILNMERSEDRLKTRVRQLEMERDKELFGLRQAKQRLGEADVTLERLGKELDRVKKENTGIKDQVKQQRSLLESIDHERDVFQMQMDQKDVELTSLTETIEAVSEEKKGLEIELYTARDQVENMHRHLNQLDSDLANVQTSLHQAIMERDKFAKEAEVYHIFLQ